MAAAHGELEENQGKNSNLVFNAFPENNHKTSVEDGVPGEDSPKDAFSAPLHRKLKSRHLQMIAIGGKLICSQKFILFFFLNSNTMRRYHWTWYSCWFWKCIEQWRTSRSPD
jgi:hypothetical protein